jgi:glycosyltransferase involved in cell wall biosynthesis
VSRDLYFVVPGPLSTRTGGFIYDRRIIQGLRARGRDVDVIELRGDFPRPSSEDCRHASAAFAAVPDGACVLVDGLAFGALPDVACMQENRLRLIALVHHPLSDETGLDPLLVPALRDQERLALERATGVIVTSPFTRTRLADFDVPSEKIRVVTPGTDPAPLARGSGGQNALLCPASLIPRKGHRDLFYALDDLRDLQWHLTCVGRADASPEYASELRGLSDKLALQERISFHAEADDDEMARLYDESDLLVLASHYEGFGMVVQEAIARGLPIVTTRGGALADTLPEGAGLACTPGNITRLRMNLRNVLTRTELYHALAQGARRARRSQPTWQDAAAAFDAALSDLT